MKVWLLKQGEPIPYVDRECNRPYRMGALAAALNKAGHDVTWWTSTFVHQRKVQLADHDKLMQVNDLLRVHLLHGPAYDRNISFMRLRQQSISASKFAAMARRSERPDLIVCSFPTLEFAQAAVRYGKEFSVPVVLDIRDWYPDNVITHTPPALRPLAKTLLSPVSRQVSAACAGATAITGITPAFVDWGLRYAGRERRSADMDFPLGYPDWEPSAEVQQEAAEFWEKQGVPASDDILNVCFFGVIGRHMVLAPLVEAARLLKERGVPMRFVICGYGDALEKLKAQAADLPQAIFPGWVKEAYIWSLMRRSHIGLALFPKTADFYNSISNKVIEYMSAGLPILSNITHGTLQQLITRHNLGQVFNDEHPEEIADLLTRLWQDREALATHSRNALETYAGEYSAEKAYGEMVHHLEKIVPQQTAEESVGNQVFSGV